MTGSHRIPAAIYQDAIRQSIADSGQ